ncbi:NAD+ synthase [Pacificitalea manganoxidans]|uniref:Glutamine-dependent NAD(+) synthetase n=1 Tax=Pacificitalea manganoxidans TaxID=1411902 RepID=A0A291LX12_9RHOB|nr:NAD+ synthase [Pacificitalea manganoxidans]ATI41273.1 NAD+ synthase [Pacificitalea manganoxidans]MAQ47070.1 NAD+ synthase [Actibacterium sp.]MDR6308667.1 NAD+ synthase [Pacificitalea manganoxidans]|tara:strand:+ start:109 stop:1788 length:1680 start_codon:yes stop_codon:yes gene_type:complete
MTDRFRLTLAQLNATVGALDDNAARARAAWEEARAAGADLVALPEMFLTGYQTQDLVRKPAFVAHADRVLEDLARACADGPAMGIGAPIFEDGKLYNAYFVLQDGKIAAQVYKHHLPHDDVFDEYRLYTPGQVSGPYRLGPLRIGTPICEDAWHEDVAETLAETGAEILLVPNGSPYHRHKMGLRQSLMVSRVIETGLPLAYLNMVGGQDDQVFDGGSFVLNPGGALAVQMPMLEEAVTHVEFTRTADGWVAEEGARAPIPDAWEQDYHVMVLALRDYMRKTGFKQVLLGLSGGIDSAICATIAADAIGPENVRCVMLPSEYTSATSLEDAADVAQRLGCRLDEVPITGPRAAVTEALAPLFAGTTPDLTEENIQSRLRGVILMALSNKFGEMLLTTGNKSEVAVGYATIYGDMNGGYNPIKDLYKMRVFETCRWRNANHRDWMMGPGGEVIPPRVIDKPPSAELREDQKDEDSLPPYEVLDRILELLVDQEASVAEAVAEGFDEATVKKIEHLIYISEYKRFQSAPGPRLTNRAFWLDRRYPIVNRWRDPGVWPDVDR